MPTTPPIPQTQSGSNSLLNLLNPYASASLPRPKSRSRSGGGHAEPESPSTMLLRELQGDAHGASGSSRIVMEDIDEGRERYLSGNREELSPTPTPSHRRSLVNADVPLGSGSRSRSNINAHSSTSSDGEGDGDDLPPRSLMYANSGERGQNRSRASRNPESSPGPFQPPSSSTSDSRSRSRSESTSPGPSTISNYASGMEATNLEPSSAVSTVSTSIAKSPSPPPSTSISPVRHIPTFREPPRPSLPARTASGSSSRHNSKGKGKASLAQEEEGQGYLDPPLSSSRTSRKGKARSIGGRRYHQVSTTADREEEDSDNERTRADPKVGKQGLNEYEKALWQWVNVDDLDGFLQEVYTFYKGKGFYCIFLAKLLNLLTTFFVIGFSTFLLSCIDYSKLWSTTSGPDSIARLDDVLIDRCLTSGSIPHMLFIFTVMIVYAFQVFTFCMSIPRLLELHRFYTHLLGIPDVDIQTLPWPEIVRLIGEIRKHNPITSLSNGQASALADMVGDDADTVNIKKLDAHDVANRILRQENYLIALFNKDLLDLRFRFPIPQSLAPHIPTRFLAPPAPAGTDNLPSNNTQLNSDETKYLSFGANTLTKALEWNLRYCLMGYLFDRRGQVRKEFVKERRRKDLVEGLKHRFVFMGCLNLLFSPFIVIYLLVYSFFRYFEEYHKNPSSIGGRQYTPYAQWTFREFNELPHLFERRLDRSYPVAKEYIDQFPKERTALVMRFVAFVAGSFAAVLLVASLIDPDLFLRFEITPHRTVLFYLGIFGSILAIARGMVPEENLVFDPEASLRELVYWTHYLPGEWKGKLHSQMVHTEFSTLFQLKIQVFFTELLSVLLTPWILFFSLPPCSATIIDFFREFTVHVDGIGYVCSFAVFDFQRHGTVKADDAVTAGATDTGGHAVDNLKGKGDGPDMTKVTAVNTGARTRQKQRDYKMEKSFLHFKATHPDWQPDLNGSLFLDKVSAYQPKSQTKTNAHAHGGGRGLGIGYGQEERSASYDRAWAKGSHLLRSRLDPYQERSMAGSRLAPMRENEDEDEVDESSWNRGAGNDEDQEEEEEGFMRDAGMIGLLQQVLKR